MSESISLSGGDWLFKDFIGEDWLWRDSHKPATRDVLGWRRGSVPGSVQQDLWQAGAIPDPYYERNSLLIEWVPARTWLYKKHFVVGEGCRGRRVQLRCAGVDYSARFFLNGEALGEHNGMFTPAVFEAGNYLLYGADNLLAVVIDPAPIEQPQVGYSSRVRTHKSRMGYWWDFCPRLIHLGIWDDVSLEVTGEVRLEDVFVQPHLAESYDRADVSVSIELSAHTHAEVEVETRILFRERELAGACSHHVLAPGRTNLNVCLDVSEPQLWWPNGYGGQPLYEAEVKVFATGDGEGATALLGCRDRPPSDQRNVPFGMRRIEFAANETADTTARPYTFIVNGRKLYAKGWNWVPIDALYGVERPAKLARLLELARRAGVNLLRVWGGGLIEKDAFYDLCDRLGILVWQEFIQSSSGIENVPPDDPAFLALLADEARQIVPRRRNHPSLALWCGGNELMDAAKRPADEAAAPALAVLQAVVRELDPERGWLPASPSGRSFGYTQEAIAQDPLGLHDVHGPWEHQGLEGQYALYNQGTSLLHSEFGVEGLSNLAALERSLGPENRWPVSRANPAWFHTSAWWLREDTIRDAFGDLADLETTVRASQFLQAEGLRYAVEADRRRKYHNSGTLPWQFNEPYPNAACTSAVDYFARPKPAYHAVARAYAPVHVSARFERQAGYKQQDFTAEIWANNSHTGALSGAQLSIRLVDAGGTTQYHDCREVSLPGNAALRLATVDWSPREIDADIFFLDLALAGDRGTHLSANRYLFSRSDDLRPMLSLPGTSLQAQLTRRGEGWRCTLSNTGAQAALCTWLTDARPVDSDGYVYFSDNYLHLLPGETRVVAATWQNVPSAERVVAIQAWNAPGLVLGP